MDTDKGPSAENALGGFLRARRAQLRPEDTGFPTSGRRRVPGLRREEVATLAGVSADYYMRLEQGRERHPSQQILEAVARALRLDDEAMAHLYRVATPTTRRTRRAPRVERVAPHLRRLIDTWSGTPAFVLGHALDILDRNRLAGALYAGFTHADNLLRMTFLDPAAPHFYRDWDRAAESSVATLRRAAGIDPDDPRLRELVGELSMKSADFRVLWARHDVRGKTRDAKLFHHAQVGDLELHYEAFTVNSAPSQQLIIYLAEPGSTSAEALALLGSLSASPVPAQDLAMGTD
ncbi:helix-turn-helix transcriptional regulator [Actinoallomurus purpureus]|uniref:helix-turn-helix transcriptional regulator n=1 Tax=Actinoallomurus purpureus TaxID=478114 RepID=UPI00209364D3|nr:helix-turn-helix transcriptional regulator [Actinoallomurus purpureus]MCO6010459.1 helix-turn-helix transcriptional regulator [Actinoallomurus purpureus]